jgi:DNA-binding PadR family transcriptional regulator
MESFSKVVLSGVQKNLSVAKMAKLNSTNHGVVSQMLSNLARHGYLDEHDLGVCASCPMASSCGTTPHKSGIKLYALTEKGRRYLNETTQ